MMPYRLESKSRASDGDFQTTITNGKTIEVLVGLGDIEFFTHDFELLFTGFGFWLAEFLHLLFGLGAFRQLGHVSQAVGKASGEYLRH